MVTREHASAPSPLVTIKEAVGYLKLSEAYLYALIGRKRLPVVRFGRRTMITKAALDAYIANNTRPAAPTTPRKRGRPPKFPRRQRTDAAHRATL